MNVRAGVATVAVTALLVTASSAQAAPISFTATLTTDQETMAIVPTTTTGDPRPEAFGSATFLLDDTDPMNPFLTMSVEVTDIDVTGMQTADANDNLVAAHIHCCALPGENGGVRWGFFGLPDNDTMPDDLVVTPFAAGVGGTFTSIWNAGEGQGGQTLLTTLPDLLAGRTYINFHTTQFGAGEIRGQILQVPEPSLLLLGGIAAASLARRRVRRRMTSPR